MSKRCSVLCDTPAGVLSCELELPEQATIAAALSAARELLGETALDWEHAPVGIYGRIQPRTHVPVHGDRIELYRPLLIEPRASRRLRARQEALAGSGSAGRRQPRRG